MLDEDARLIDIPVVLHTNLRRAEDQAWLSFSMKPQCEVFLVWHFRRFNAPLARGYLPSEMANPDTM